MPRVGLYLRISDDQNGTSTATSRQRLDCERFAEQRGWQVVDVFEDADISAFKRKVQRPQFERLIEAVREKQIDGVLCWKLDRLFRRQRDLVRLDEACEDARGFFASVVDSIDTSTTAGRFTAELLTSMARMESENISVRGRRKHLERAKQGLPQAGGHRMFGYSMDRMQIIAHEAALIREGARRILDGESVRGICLDWGKRGVKTPTGREWQQITFKHMLLSAALSGQREYGARSRPDEALLMPGNWPAILTPDDTRRLRLVLNDKSRHKNLVGNARSYLLSGFLRCGRCGEPLVARPTGEKVRRYVCARAPGRANCGKLARAAEPVEELVRDAIVHVLDGVDLRAYIDEGGADHGDHLFDAIRQDEEALVQLSKDFYVDHLIERAEYFAARDAIDSRLRDARARLSQQNGHGMLNHVAGAGETVRSEWDGQTLPWKRAIVSALVDHIVLEQALMGRNSFDPSKVRIVWKF